MVKKKHTVVPKDPTQSVARFEELPVTLGRRGGIPTFIPYLGIGPDGLTALGTGVGAELLKALDTAVASFLLHILLPVQRGATIVAVETLGHGAHGVAAGTCSEADRRQHGRVEGRGKPWAPQWGHYSKPRSQEAKTTVGPLLTKEPGVSTVD